MGRGEPEPGLIRRRPLSAVGVYRLWRDSGYAVDALLAGFMADALGIRVAILAIAGLTALSGLEVAWRMPETRPASARPAPPARR